MRIELATSSLPRKCSTTELQRHCFIHTYNNKDELQAALLLFKFYFQHLFPSLSIFSLSGKRGSNPPPIAWKAIALPNELLPLAISLLVGEIGLEPMNSEEDRFTVCCNCRYATPPTYLNTYFNCEPAEGFGPPTPRLQITCSTAELCRLLFQRTVPKKAHHSFIPKWCAKLQLFYILTTFFLLFFQKFFKKTVNALCINT